MFTSCSPRPHQRWSLGSHDLRPPNRFTPTSDDTPVRHPPTLPSPGPVTDATLPTPRLTSPRRHLPLLRTPTTALPPTPLPPTPPPRRPTFAASATRRQLDEFNKKYLGLATSTQLQPHSVSNSTRGLLPPATTFSERVPGPPPSPPGPPSSVPPLAARTPTTRLLKRLHSRPASSLSSNLVSLMSPPP